MGTIANSKFTLSQFVVQKTVPVFAKVTYWIIIINNSPNELANPAVSMESHSGCPSILIAPFTLNELEKKKTKKNGAYIARTINNSGWNILTPINQNL